MARWPWRRRHVGGGRSGNSWRSCRTTSTRSAGPLREGKLLGPAEFHALPEREQVEIRGHIETVNEALKAGLQSVNSWQEETLEMALLLAMETLMETH